MNHVIIYAPEPDPAFQPPWIFEVVGWNWERRRPYLDPIQREMLHNYTAAKVEVPAGTILCFGRKRAAKRHYSVFNYSIVTKEGTQMPLSQDNLVRFFRGI